MTSSNLWIYSPPTTTTKHGRGSSNVENRLPKIVFSFAKFKLNQESFLVNIDFLLQHLLRLTLHFRLTFIDEVIAPLYLIVALKMTLLIWEKGKVWWGWSPKLNRRQFFIFVVFHSKNFVMKSDFSWSLKPLTLLRWKTKISDLIHYKDDIYRCMHLLPIWLIESINYSGHFGLFSIRIHGNMRHDCVIM